MSQQIIDDPKRSKPQRKLTEKSLIVVGTGLIIYFFLMITLLVWYFAGVYVIDTVFSWRHMEATVDILLRLVLVALITAMIFLGWGEYNYRTYAHLNRRKKPAIVSIREMAELFDVNEEDVLMAQVSKYLFLHVDEEHHIICDSDQGCLKIRKFEEILDQSAHPRKY